MFLPLWGLPPFPLPNPGIFPDALTTLCITPPQRWSQPLQCVWSVSCSSLNCQVSLWSFHLCRPSAQVDAQKEEKKKGSLNNSWTGSRSTGLSWLALHCTEGSGIWLHLLPHPVVVAHRGACPRAMKDDDKLTSLWFIQIDHVSMRLCIHLAFWPRRRVKKQLH